MTVPLRELLAQFDSVPPKSNTTARDDDSGLIDLAALVAESKGNAPAPVLAHAPIFPFGAPEPEPQPVVATATAEEPAKPVAKSRKGAWIAAACALVAVAAIAGGVNAATASSGEAMALSTGLAPFAEQGALVARAATPPEPVASIEKPEEPESEPKAEARTPTLRGPIVNRPKGPVANKGGEVVKKDPPAKPKDPCNGDLMCAMRRATGK
ncbi:hypothetical protein [Polyangium aurulentum]|uniref:hypothetical protein n=1 Tax=Polyangium aurulentum TaxID=2567896 RepID=UPI0010ADDD9E|nr:hypothetical protein [Polyangium aurulentum]UQA58273.1 hypothetical protein E8A73_044685 [Polyangium aurulentum]